MEHVVVANFRRDWVRENIDASVYLKEDRDHPEIEAAARLMVEAARKGISRSDLERGVGDLEEFLSECIESARERAANRRTESRR